MEDNYNKERNRKSYAPLTRSLADELRERAPTYTPNEAALELMKKAQNDVLAAPHYAVKATAAYNLGLSGHRKVGNKFNEGEYARLRERLGVPVEQFNAVFVALFEAGKQTRSTPALTDKL